MSDKTPEQMYKEVQESLGYHVATNLLTIVSMPVTLLTKAWTLVSNQFGKSASGVQASKS